jgi:hypothetical protein
MTSQRVLACTSGVLCSLAILAGSAAAQAPAAPKPGPEHEALKYFAGKWTTEGEMKASPMMPGGKFSSSDNCELFSGGFYVVCHSTGKNPAGPMHGLGILGYDLMKKTYTYYGIGNQMPAADVSEGKHEGDSWVYTGVMDDGTGKKIQGRYTMSNLTPNAYMSKYEVAPEGSSEWTMIMEGKSTRGAAPMKSTADSVKKDTAAAAKKAGDATKIAAEKTVDVTKDVAKKAADVTKEAAKKTADTVKKP